MAEKTTSGTIIWGATLDEGKKAVGRVFEEIDEAVDPKMTVLGQVMLKYELMRKAIVTQVGSARQDERQVMQITGHGLGRFGLPVGKDVYFTSTGEVFLGRQSRTYDGTVKINDLGPVSEQWHTDNMPRIRRACYRRIEEKRKKGRPTTSAQTGPQSVLIRH